MGDYENLKRRVLNRFVYIKCLDQRIIRGQIKVVDHNSNVILNDVIVQIPDDRVSTINKEIEYMLTFKEQMREIRKKYFKQSSESENEFWENKFYTKGYIVPFPLIDQIETLEVSLEI